MARFASPVAALDPRPCKAMGDFYRARGVTAELRDLALADRTPQQSYDGIAWFYGGP